jgi:hypothetical protein
LPESKRIVIAWCLPVQNNLIGKQAIPNDEKKAIKFKNYVILKIWGAQRSTLYGA